MAKDTNWILVIAVIALAYFVLVGNPFEKPVTPPADNDGDNGAGCGVEDVSFTPKMTRMGKAGTAITTGENYFIITDKLGHQAASSAVTVPTNKDLQIMFGENSTQYYTVVKTVSTACSDPFYYDVQLPLYDASLNSFYAKNADGTVNSGTVGQAMTTDDTFETTVTFKAGVDTYFGNPTSNCENIAIAEYDKTYIKSVYGDDPVAVPGSFSYHNATYDGSQAWIIPKSADGEEVDFNMVIESAGSEPASTPMLIVNLRDCDIDKNEDTLALIEGVEDEDLNSISLASQELRIYID